MNTFADSKIKLIQMKVSVFVTVENIAGKRENAGYQHFFLHFPQCFQKASWSGSVKVVIVCQRIKIKLASRLNKISCNHYHSMTDLAFCITQMHRAPLLPEHGPNKRVSGFFLKSYHFI